MQPELGLSPPPEIVGAEVSKRLKALSLSAKDIEELGMSHDEEYLLAQADYTEAQMKKKDSVASPAAYFKAAVTNNYAKAPSKQKQVGSPETSAPAQKPQKAKKPAVAAPSAPANQMNVLLEQWGAAQRSTIRDEINAQSPEEQQLLLAKYESQLKKDDLAYKQFKSKGLSPMVLNCLVAIIFEDRFQEAPTSDQLLQFLLSANANVQA